MLSHFVASAAGYACVLAQVTRTYPLFLLRTPRTHLFVTLARAPAPLCGLCSTRPHVT